MKTISEFSLKKLNVLNFASMKIIKFHISALLITFINKLLNIGVFKKHETSSMQLIYEGLLEIASKSL